MKVKEGLGLRTLQQLKMCNGTTVKVYIKQCGSEMNQTCYVWEYKNENSCVISNREFEKFVLGSYF